jgi:glutaredoxin
VGDSQILWGGIEVPPDQVVMGEGMPDIELFVMTGCFFCGKVLRFMERNDLQVPVHDILADRAASARLVRVGGDDQVPCLFIDGKAMYESDDIIAWMREHLVKTKVG